ncbi:unnamed protein product [Trichobilharzia szidati]|nr:unnamed protein product [Trichobilharzia szidati]
MKRKTGESQPGNLVCTCNDNSHCVATSYYRTSKRRSHMGNCTVYSDGRCYTARAINVEALGRYLRSQVNAGADRSVASSPKIGINPAKLHRFIHVIYGCLDSHDKTTLACNSHLTKHAVPQAIECCNSSNMCNANLFPKFMHHDTDEDALRAAVEHFEKNNIWREQQLANGNLRLKPYINVGPDMLIGGSAIEDRPYDKLKKNALWKEDLTVENRAQYLFHVVLIVTFSLVFIILSLVLASVCCVYKRRTQRRKHHLSAFNSESSSVVKLSEVGAVCDNKPMKRWSYYKDLRSMHPVCVKFEKSGKPKDGSNPHTVLTELTHNLDGSLVEKSRSSVGPISSSGLLHLIPQTIGKQITLDSLLGAGHFSHVWIGTWKGERIVAKVFKPNDRLSRNIWRRTVLLHRSMLLRHQGIHGLMAVDWLNYPTDIHLSAIKRYSPNFFPTTPSPCALLVGEICAYGTLKDLLSYGDCALDSLNQLWDSSIDKCCDMTSISDGWLSIMNDPGGIRLRILLQVANSLVQGLCFLHSEFAGTRGKPALAHRDLKPSNIYIRSDWSCCIGDIGLAVRSPPCPFPVPVDRLHMLYHQYENYSTKYSHSNSQSSEIHSSKKTEVDFPFVDRSPNAAIQKEALLATNNRNRLHESCSQNTGSSDKWSCILEDAVDKSRFDKLDLLNWWPIGGIQIGTPRYLAPELLSKSINPFCFESYQKSDIYALSLILWEIVNWALPKSIWSDQDTFDTAHLMTGCSSSKRQSSADSMSLTNSNSSLISKSQNDRYSSVYLPVYQNEWLKLLKCTRNSSDAVDILKSLSSSSSDLLHCPLIQSFICPDSVLSTSDGYTGKVDASNYLVEKILVNEQIKNMEPDLQTMYHLVCEQQVRPRLPSSVSSSSFPMKIADTILPIDYYPQYIQSLGQNMNTHVVQLHTDNTTTTTNNNNTNNMDAICVNKALTSAVCRECSSSGASSLQSHHTNHDSDNKRLTNQSQLMKIMKLQCLIANQFATLLPECWASEPDSRLSALRIKKRVQHIYELVDDLVNKPPVYTEMTVNIEGENPQCIIDNLKKCTNDSSTPVNTT